MSKNNSTACDRIIDWGIPLVGAAIMIIFSLISLNPLAIKSTILQCGAVTIFTAWAIKTLKSGTIEIGKPFSRVMIPAAAFMLSAVFSFLFITSSRDTSLEELMVRIPYFMIFLIAALAFADMRKIRIALGIITLASFVVAAYGMLQHFSLDPIGYGDSIRIQSTFGNPNFYVGFLTLMIPVTAAAFDLTDAKERIKTMAIVAFITGSAILYYLLTQLNESQPLHAAFFLLMLAVLITLCYVFKLGVKSFSSVTLFLLINNIFLTRSRSGQIGFGTALIIFVALVFIYILPRLSLRKNITIIVGLFILAGLVTCGVLYISYSDNGRLITVSERKYYVEGALNLIEQKPVFGHGIGTFKNNYPLIKKAESWAYNAVCFEHVSNVYNEHLEIFHDEGLIGFGIWVWLLATFFLLLLKAIKVSAKSTNADRARNSTDKPKWAVSIAPSEPILLIGLVSGIAALLVGNIFSLSMRYTSTGYFFWLFLGMATGCASRILAEAPSTATSNVNRNPSRHTGAIIRIIDAALLLVAGGAVIFSIRIYLADVYLNSAVNYSKDAYTPVDTTGVLFHDIFIEGTQYRSDSLTWEKALRYYRKSISNNPYNLRAHYFYGNAFNRRWNLRPQYNPDWGDRDGKSRTDIERLMEHYNYIIAQAPHFTEIDFELGDLYMKLGRFDKAIEHYKDYKRYKPFFTKTFYALANAYVAKQDWSNAAESYKDALDLNRKFTVGYLELSAVYYKLGKSDLSDEMFERAREVSPDKVYIAMSDVWQRFGEKQLSIECLHKRIAQDSTDERPYLRLGWDAIENKQWEQAIDWYEKAVRFNPKHAPAWVNLSNLYYNIGKIDEAKAAYERAYAADSFYVQTIVREQAN
jgi:tetratricopeptide (TPR) repeat protein